jgi:RimJ/RimL family protein N-acetyltransferase
VPAIRIFPATVEHLAAYSRDPSELSSMLGSPLPAGWPEFPEAIPHTLKVLEEASGDADWWMYFFVDEATGVLVGSGGFAGAPRDGVVEIGYEIAPGYRRRGYATAAATELVQRAVASGQVRRIVAQTLAQDPRSAGVLRATGFDESGRTDDSEHGEIIDWQRLV